MLDQLKKYFVSIKSKFYALEPNVRITFVLLFAGIFFAGVFAIFKTCAIDWLNLMATMIGTILFPILIWYFSSVRSDEIKNKEYQIGILNAVFAEIFIISRNLSRMAKETHSKMLIADKEIANIEYSKTMQNAMNGIVYHHPINQTQGEILNEITYRFQIKYSPRDIKFISISDSYLFLCLYTLFSNIEVYNDAVNKTNIGLLNEVSTHNNEVKINPKCELDSLLKLFRFRVKQYQSLLYSVFGILDDIHKKILPGLVNFANKNFCNKIGMNNKDEISKIKDELEEALRLVNLDKESINQ